MVGGDGGWIGDCQGEKERGRRGDCTGRKGKGTGGGREGEEEQRRGSSERREFFNGMVEVEVEVGVEVVMW